MNQSMLILRHISFIGPKKPLALLEFKLGLNVLYGASDTGKSFVFDAIDYMLGGKNLRDIPERVGYEKIFLGFEVDDETFTLMRSTGGGQFQVFEGLHQNVPNIKGVTLLAKHTSDNENNISTFLLNKIGLSGKKLRCNAKGMTKNISFRHLGNLCLISEGNIQKKSSPIESTITTDRTLCYSLFKLLLTGIDDSALVPIEDDASQPRFAKIEFINELLLEYQKKLGTEVDDIEEFHNQIKKLEQTLKEMQNSLKISESEYEFLMSRRGELRKNLQLGMERRAEINDLLARFELLDKHYLSDLERLEGIYEAGSLISSFKLVSCPLCGADPNDQHTERDCDSNLKPVIVAADSEISKINQLRLELAQTIEKINAEAKSFDKKLPEIYKNINDIEHNIKELSPDLSKKRDSYAELIESRASIYSKLNLLEQIYDLQARRQAMESPKSSRLSIQPENTDLSSTILDHFSQQVEKLLKAWNFPEADRVYFDEKDKDLVISGKRRGSRGKGMRAITHAAFTVGLLEYCKRGNLPHPGFIVLDSPLLAYREPEGAEDDLSGTDVQDKFYEYLSSLEERQVIIIENTDPPQSIVNRPTTILFSKNPQNGRYGFFPNNS